MGKADIAAVARPLLEPELFEVEGDVAISDPSAIYDADRYWVFATGPQLPISSSGDLLSFERVGDAFADAPTWIADEVPDASGFWSPDVVYFNGKYHLYYAVSKLGDNQSCIGHATAESLPSAESWVDQGPVICSTREDNWNAIDPNVLDDGRGARWLALGSFRSGIKLVLLDDDGMRSGSDLLPLAKQPGAGMIQAPALSKHGDYFYLFASLGENEAHTLVVGRASSIRGPYVDRDGVDMWEGGGTLLLTDSERFRGPGSNDVLNTDTQALNFFHAYDTENKNRARLRVSTLVWDDEGWPVTAGP